MTPITYILFVTNKKIMQ
nr:unnamed protein product [Callosobruchus chinensis]